MNENYECAIGFEPDTREERLLRYLFNILFIISVLFNNLNSMHYLFLLGAQHYLADHCLPFLLLSPIKIESLRAKRFVYLFCCCISYLEN